MSVAKNPKLQYLKRRPANRPDGSWYLNHPIPRELQSQYLTAAGKPQTHIVRALNTKDADVAYRRKVVLMPAILAEFAQKKRGAKGLVSSEVELGMRFREKLNEASNAEDFHLSDTLAQVVTEQAERIADAAGGSPESRARARTFVRIAEGAETLKEAFTEWLDKSDLPARTRAKYTTAFEEFAGFVGGTPLIADMNRTNAIRYVDWLNAEGRSQRTKKAVPLSYNSKRDRVMALSAFWNKGLSARNKVTEQNNPWSKLEVSEKPTSGAMTWDSLETIGRPKRRPDFDDADLKAIFDAPGPRHSGATRYGKRTLMELLTLGLITGARPDELCSLLLRDVRAVEGGYLLSFTDPKNSESIRKIPVVHPLAVAVIARRIGKRNDRAAQLFEELRPKEGGDNLYELVGRALSRHLQRAGAELSDGAVPYCTRHTLQTRMGNREDIKDVVMQRYVGHKPAGMTDKHYRNISPDALLAFARKVRYPESIERRMAQELGLVR